MMQHWNHCVASYVFLFDSARRFGPNGLLTGSSHMPACDVSHVDSLISSKIP